MSGRDRIPHFGPILAAVAGTHGLGILHDDHASVDLPLAIDPSE